MSKIIFRIREQLFPISQPSKAVFIVALILITASCTVKTMYRQLDYLIPSYVEGIVSLDSMLEEKVEQRTLVLIHWHRNTQLNQYVEWLRELQRDANNQLTEEKMLQHIATLNSFWQSIVLKVNEEMALLLPLLNAEQREELFSSVANKNHEFHEDYIDLDNDERIDQYTDRMMDIYETWLGNLTGEQEIAIKQAAARIQTTANLRLEYRQQWQQSIQRILDTNDNTSQKGVSLREYFTDYNRKKNYAMNAVNNKNRNIFARLTVQIVHSMTDKQKQHFISSTNDYIRMFNQLAKER